ncbi:MAG: DUF1707 domain-containing protein [Actinomycetota bacterium]
MADSPEIRISDAERQVMIDRLSKAYSEGRLTESELGERIMAAGEARTAGELAVLGADLPAPLPAPVDRSTMATVRHRVADMQVFFIAPVICTVIWALSDFGGYYWPAWVWLGCMIPVLFALIGGDDADADEDDTSDDT